MNELNREQIIKALECCSSKIGCKECPLQPKESLAICVTKISKYAFEEICRLTEENDRYFLDLQEQIDKNEESEEMIKELTEENERLRWISASICIGDVITPEQMEELRVIPGHGDPVGEPGECALKHKCVSDTVRRMQSDIQEACLKGGIWPAFVAGVVQGVGEKILEENNDN